MDNKKADKGGKAGPDGLTKKERRALKVASATKNPVPQSVQKNAVSANSDTVFSSVDNLKNKFPQANIKTLHSLSDKGNVTIIPPKDTTRKSEKLVQETTKVKAVDSHSDENLKHIKPPVNDAEVSKTELRTQRRALQEAQRLAKQQKEEQAKKPVAEKKEVIKKQSLKKESSSVKSTKSSTNLHKVPLFNHLYYENAEIIPKSRVVNVNAVHAAFLKLGERYSSKTIMGSNARCLALLSAMKSVITDFTTPPKQEFCRSLESALQTCILYVNNCRPLAVSMTNALRHFKLYLTQINTNLSDNEKRNRLVERIETYINDDIAKAGEAISIQVRQKISNNDIILTYSCSSLITKILLDAYKEGKTFKVIVVDGRPLLEGREMLRKLTLAGIQCTYILINAASFIMSKVTKVLLGAHALLANGYVMSRTGTAQIALIANAYKKPVLVCCETYKFSERVQTDSFVYNEIGNPDQLVSIDTSETSSPLVNWRNSNYLTPLNLMYDVTPPDLVTAVVTELAFLPCTSVPVVLRIRPTEVVG